MTADVENVADEVVDVQQTTCCVVGGGPGGVMLALLLARRGVPVTLLEAHPTFDRDFRGDSLHPALLEILDEISLAERLHQLPHAKVYGPSIPTKDGPLMLIDLRRLRTKFPYVMMIAQPLFLAFVAEEAKKYPSFRLIMGANVQRLVQEQEKVCGVRYRASDGWHEVRALLTVGADGRFSRLRHLASLPAITTSAPIELLWFRLPRLPSDPPPTGLTTPRRAPGKLVIQVDRVDHWQVGYFIHQGEYPRLRAAGLDAMRRNIVAVQPLFAQHVAALTHWDQLSLLSVASSRCRRWYRHGLLLIGDAAHTMTPAAGAGIKYAIEDAVVAANLLTGPLRAGRVRLRDLAEVQRRREWPTRIIQAFGAFMIKNVLAPTLRSSAEPEIPRVLLFLIRLAPVQYLLARLVAFGIRRVHVDRGPTAP